MSDTSADHSNKPAETGTVAQIVEGVEPMGELGQFLIDDLTPEQENAFYRILEET